MQWDYIGWVGNNLVLDTSGGPSYSKDALDAPIIMSPNYQSFTLSPSYYTLGHLSKFIPRGSVRIDLNLKPLKPRVFGVAFLRPDNITVVSLYNA